AILVSMATGASATNSALESGVVIVAPIITLALVFGFFSAKWEAARIKEHSPQWEWKNYDLHTLMKGRWARRRICFKASCSSIACVLAGAAIWLLMAVSTPVAVWVAREPRLAYALIGVAVGIAAYLTSCRRMPKVLISQAIPSHRLMH